MKYTEEQLKLALAKALPSEIIHRQTLDERSSVINVYFWRHSSARVDENHWPAIVGMIEDKLTNAQCSDYHDALMGTKPHPKDAPYPARKWTWGASWIQRATALADIGIIVIEPSSSS